MYRIIERGGNRFGPRRAFLFAKEFGRNIDVPMMYGVDTSDPGLRYFMNEYLKAGGNPENVYVRQILDKEMLDKCRSLLDSIVCFALACNWFNISRFAIVTIILHLVIL